MLYLLGVVILLCQGIKSDILIESCLQDVYCADVPDFDKYVDFDIAVVNESMEEVYKLKTEIAQYVCSFLLDTAKCIDESVNIPLICPPRVKKVFSAFQTVVRSGCSSFVTDVISLISCFNEPKVQTEYQQCLAGLEDDARLLGDGNCGLIDLAMTCNKHLSECDSAAVKNFESFVNDNKYNLCILLSASMNFRKK